MEKLGLKTNFEVNLGFIYRISFDYIEKKVNKIIIKKTFKIV
jgi:hypothetical protein